MLRRHIVLSEFSGTIMKNAKYIKENLHIFDVEAIINFLQNVEAIEIHLQVKVKGLLFVRCVAT